MEEMYSFIATCSFIIMLVGFYKFGKNTSSIFWKRILLTSGGLFLIMLAVDIMFGIVPPSEKKQSPPVIEQKSENEVKKPPEIERPEESFYKESYEAIAAKTGLRVTEHWLLEYGERVAKDGNVETHGFVEFNNDGLKRQFWLVFDGKSRRVLRVKIDADLIYNELDW